MKKFFAGVALFLVAALFALPVFAETAAALNPGSTEINLGPLVAGIVGTVGSALAFVALWIFNGLKKVPMFNKYMTMEQYQKLVNPLLDEAVAWGVGQLKDANWLKIDTKNEAVSNALGYVLEHGGEILEKFGITQSTIRQKIEAKLVANGWDTAPGQWEDDTQGKLAV